MARRSYLRRIAEPLAPGLPALFSVPGAAPDERRPPVVPAAAGTPALRRTTTPSASIPAAATPLRTPLASAAGSRKAAPNMPPSPTGGRSLFAVPGTAPNGTAIATGIASPSPIAPGSSRPPTDPTAEAFGIAAADAMPLADRGAGAFPRDPPASPLPRVEPASPRIHIGTVEVRTTPQPQPPAAVQPPSHAVPTAPRDAAAPVSRAYGWRYGLIQS